MLKVFFCVWISFLNFNATVFATGNKTIDSYSQAKHFLYQIFSITGGKTLYCDCTHADRIVNAASCGYVPSSNNDRAKRTELEHMVPASVFGRSFEEWQNPENFSKCWRRNGKRKKRRDCARTNLAFSRMEADMYNLWLSIGELNADRANFSLGIIPGESRDYGSCDFEVSNKKVEPRPEVRGIMARAYLYMDSTYPNKQVIPTESFRSLLRQWQYQYPVSKAEKKWAQEIFKIQGNCNPFILNCKSIQGEIFQKH